MSTIPQWTGREVKALRSARRMSIRAFAAHLGVSDRMVSKWESGGEAVRPRSMNQVALDSSLATANVETRTRFERLVGGRAVHIDSVNPGSTVRHLVRHPVDGKLMTFVEPGPFEPAHGPARWLPGYYIDVLPTTCADYAGFLTMTGHQPPSEWIDGSYAEGLAESLVQVPWPDAQAYARWAGKALPTMRQWDRAALGEEGMHAGHLAEWTTGSRGVRRHEARHGRTKGDPSFRCVVSGPEMLALLAI